MYSRSGAAVHRLKNDEERDFRCPIFRAAFDSRSLFFASKPHGNHPFYSGYDGKRRVSLIKPSLSFPVDLFSVFVLLLFQIYLFFWSKEVFWPPILVNLPSDRKVVYADVL